MFKSIGAVFLVIMAFLLISGCDKVNGFSPTSPSLVTSSGNLNKTSGIKEAIGDIVADLRDPETISGVELVTIRGWLANMYPWEYVPESSTVHPVSRLWTPHRQPYPFQLSEQCRQIKEFGGGAVVLEYSPNPDLGWHNYWLSNGFARECGPFFLLYEHMNGTRFIPPSDDSKDMNNPYNRQIFKADMDFMFKEVIFKNQSRYITVNGRAVIYLWSSVQMTGDFASLLEEVKKEYPVFFLGSGEGQPKDTNEDVERVKALDGFMEYSLGPADGNYLRNVQNYRHSSFNERQFLRRLELETGKKYIFIPTFQAAYDNTKTGKINPPMYARSLDEVKYHAEMIRNGMGSIYDFVGPFVVYSELPEGAAVIESQCLPTTIDTPNRFVGCGTARLQILKEYFSW